MPRTSTKACLNVSATDYRLDNQIGFQMRRAYQRASANLTAQLAGFNLTPPQFSTLAKLYECGRISQNLLGRLVAMEPPNIRDVVLRLRKRGLIRAERDAADKRLVLLSLTASGSSLFETLRPLSTRSTAETLAPLRNSERKLFLDLLRRVADG